MSVGFNRKTLDPCQRLPAPQGSTTTPERARPLENIRHQPRRTKRRKECAPCWHHTIKKRHTYKMINKLHKRQLFEGFLLIITQLHGFFGSTCCHDKSPWRKFRCPRLSMRTQRTSAMHDSQKGITIVATDPPKLGWKNATGRRILQQRTAEFHGSAA